MQASLSPIVSESDESIPDAPTERAPLLTLFDDQLVSRSKPPVEHTGDRSSETQSPKAEMLRSRLLGLLPPLPEIQRILRAMPRLYALMSSKYSEFHPENLPALLADGPESLRPEALGNLAKLLLYLALMCDQLSTAFGSRNAQTPLSPKESIDHVVSFVENMLHVEETISSTFPGIECFYLAGKYHINAGHPRKAWRLCRRGIEFAQLRGLHLSSRRPIQSDDKKALRQSYTWSSLACLDRYLSLILGLPYAVADRFVTPQLTNLANTGYLYPSEEYIHRLYSFSGQILDRNYDANEVSLQLTLKLERELAGMSERILHEFGSAQSKKSSDENLIVQFIFNFIRVMLHLPFVIKSELNMESRFCGNAAVESSRTCIQIYRKLREETDFGTAVCKMIDFQMFTAAMLLGTHILRNMDRPEYSSQEKAADWRLLEEAARIFRENSNDSNGSVAAQSANVLDLLLGRSPKDTCETYQRNGCKINIPYFGTIHIRPGKKIKQMESCYRGHSSTSIESVGAPRTNANPYITPAGSTPASTVTPSDSTTQVPFLPLEDHSVSLENILALPSIDSDGYSTNNVNMDMSGWQPDPRWDLDLGLDQGWNLDWFNL